MEILDAGPMFTLTEAVSISVETDDQAESDRLNAALIANGGEQSHCGWLKDRFGVSWQIFPKRLTELTTNADKNVSARAMAAMMTQMKIDIAVIEAAVKSQIRKDEQSGTPERVNEPVLKWRVTFARPVNLVVRRLVHAINSRN